MLHVVWRGGSLRSWIAFAMALAILPLAASAVAGYLVLGRGVIASFQDVAARQRNQIDPLQRLRMHLLDAETPLDDFVDEGDAREGPAYRVLRQEIESLFANVREQLRDDPQSSTLVERAQADWTAADRMAAEALSVRRAAGDAHDAALMDGFHGLVGSAVDKLGVAYENLMRDLRDDHDAALRDVDRSKWLAVAAAAVSALAILVAVVIIGRVIAGSVERLVNGAELFAAGDRDHRIDVSVPPELQRVAVEFNRMIDRIHESESALENLARRDSLTLLHNRRAFDETLAEMFARQHRNGEPFALVVLDLDHFKRINDTHGHAAGDDVLRGTSQALTAVLRPFDQLFRIGGEEFAALLTGADAAAAALVAERLRQAAKAHPTIVGAATIPVTVSVGVVIATNASQADTLVKTADAALYQAKAAGRDRVVFGGEVRHG